MDGVKENQGITLNPNGSPATWYGLPVPDGIDHIGQETVHFIHTATPQWRCWWYKNGEMEHIILDVDIPHVERILSALAIMRMSDGSHDKEQVKL